MIFVGCDISFNSPAVTMYNSENDTYIVLFVGNKKKFENFNMYVSNFHFVNIIGDDYLRFKTLNTKDENRFLKMEHINEKFIEIIKENVGNKKIKMIIEQCAFNAVGSSGSKLYENSSIFKYLYIKKFGYTFKEISPTSLKKTVTGNGHASKFEMYSVIQKEFPAVDFLTTLKSNSKIGTIISPLEDVIDSLAFCLVAKDHKFSQNNIINNVVDLLYKG